MTDFAMHADFLPSLRALAQKGGPGQRASDTALKAWQRSQKQRAAFDDVFDGIPLTNHGENRIANCRKFDLTGFSRLVTAYSKNVCVFLFVGDHNSVDSWLEKNRGLDIIGRSDGKKTRLAPVYVSDQNNVDVRVIDSPIDLQSNGPIIALLEQYDRDALLVGLSEDFVRSIEAIEAITDEDEILQTMLKMPAGEQTNAIFDVLLVLRASDKVKAKNRIDQFTGVAKSLSVIPDEALVEVASSESIVMVQDVDPILFQHFVQTANFKQWMLYLHPAQRAIVDQRFDGTSRLAGVSGSGKTCVVVHRAIRLAKAEPNKSVLIITLNDALAKLINDLVSAQCGDLSPENIQIKSIFQLCAEHLADLEPGSQHYYLRRTSVKNQFAASEHIDEIWREFFYCENNNRSADVMLDLIKTLAVRGVSAQDYIRQELDYVRSALPIGYRKHYLKMERTGRVVPLTEQYRVAVLSGLEGWEEKMKVVGAVDDLGIVTALYKHIDSILPRFHHTLVDEVQDLGTLELEIIRKLTHVGPDDLFLCGDAAQSVQTKHAEFKTAGINIPKINNISLKQNYRNSSQILSAAYDVLTKSFENIPVGTVDIDILPPEFANFSSPNPALLSASSFKDELAVALSYVDEILPKDQEKKACIAICGFTQKSVEELASKLSLPVLSDTSNITSGYLFLSDLEQTKGFEFDLMIIINCSNGVIPHPELPEEEWFRDLSKLYVALTRAKTELVVSYSGQFSVFLNDSLEKFNLGQWIDYGIDSKDLNQLILPDAALERTGDLLKWSARGADFLKLRDAIGLSSSAQDAILNCVTGRERTEGRAGGKRKQLEWRFFNDFIASMQNRQNSVSVISVEVWEELQNKYSSFFKKFTNEGVEKNEAVDVNDSSDSGLKGALVPSLEDRTYKIFRPQNIESFSDNSHSAYLLACLLVANNVNSVIDLTVGRPMSSEALHFLLDSTAIKYWKEQGWLRSHRSVNGIYFLTKAGVVECRLRLINSNEKNISPRNKLSVPQEFIESFYQAIIDGQSSSASLKSLTFIGRTFDKG